MAGGAQLISGLLQAAVGDPTTNSNPAAGAYAVTPEMALKSLNGTMDDDSQYKTVQEAIDAGEDISPNTRYLNRNGEDVTEHVKSPDDLLPMQKPNFFQRWFNPGESDRANAINSQFGSSPLFTAQAHDVAQGLAARDFSKVQPAIGSGAGSWSPEVGAIATGNNPTMQGIAGANMPSLAMGAGLPQSDIDTLLKRDMAEGAVADNEAQREYMKKFLRIPNTEARAENSNLTAGILNSGNVTANALAEGSLRATELSGKIAAQPKLNDALAAEAAHAAEMGEFQRTLELYEKMTLGNRAKLEAAQSRYGAMLPPLASEVTPSGNYKPVVRTGTPQMNPQQAMAPLVGGAINKALSEQGVQPYGNAEMAPKAIIGKDGKPLPLPPQDIYNKGTPILPKGDEGEYTTDEQGNLYKGGKLIGKLKK